jgi:hypothetical protein
MNISLWDPALTDAIYRAILAAYTQSPAAGLPPAQDCNKTFINRAWPGQQLSEADYLNPWTPSNDKGSQYVTENISRLVDQIPVLNEAYAQSGSQVSDVYQLILMASPTVAGSAGSTMAVPNKGAILYGAAGPIAGPDDPSGDFLQQELERQYADASANLIANRLQFDLSNPVEKDRWEKLAPTFEAAVRSAREKLAAKKPAARKTISSFFQTSGADNPVANVLGNANKLFSATILSSLMNPGVTYHPSYLSPDTFADPATVADWPTMPSIKATTSDGGLEVNISFQFCRVDIRRPWLLMSLMEMRGWKLPGQPAGSFSNGSSKDNDGSFPLLPEHFVVARHLKITGVGTDAATVYYAADGLEILAWINRIVPFIPPAY